MIKKKPEARSQKQEVRGKKSDTSVLAKTIARIAADHKAVDIKILDLRKLTSFTDYFIICSGASDRQVQAVANSVYDDLKKAGRLPISEEGVQTGLWALLDYGDVVVHVFYQDEREHYQLEKLWHDAPRVKFSPKPKTQSPKKRTKAPRRQPPVK